MEILNLANKIIKIIFINIMTYYVFIKIINYRDNTIPKMLCITIYSVIETIVEVMLQPLPIYVILIGAYSIYGLLIATITKKPKLYAITITFISLTITYVIYIVNIILVGVLLRMIKPNIQTNSIIIIILIMLNETLIIYKLFKTKRFKNGIAFLQNKINVSNIGIIGMAFIGITIIIYVTFSNTTERKAAAYLFIGILIEAVCLFVWIRRRITRFYKQKLKERTVEELEKEIEAQSVEISKITEENQSIASINHKYSSRIKALESFSSKVLSKPELVAVMKTEFGDDFANFEKQVQSISKEFTMEMENNIKHEVYLPKTEIFGIDNLLEHMCNEASKENIKFNLKINGNIKYMVENVIEQNRLETLLGDHIKDAIIAIKSSTNTYKSILVILGIIEDCYEICIYDTGIEFEIETLLKLGTERITTHKKTGGNGIGFMTTFETLDKTKASLIIEENHPMNSKDYTKAVKVRFDGKNEYRINSYRAEKIEEQTKNDRIKIKLKT